MLSLSSDRNNNFTFTLSFCETLTHKERKRHQIQRMNISRMILFKERYNSWYSLNSSMYGEIFYHLNVV